MNNGKHYDVAILGGGPAGCRAALRAAEAGLRVLLAEPGFIGGSCVNAGCIPTKFLLGSTSSLPLFTAQKERCALSGNIGLELPALQDEKEAYVKKLRHDVQARLQDAGVTLIKSRGVFAGPDSLALGTGGRDGTVGFTHCIVAVGSVPAVFPGLKPDGKNVLAAASLLNLREIPKSLLLVGGGAIGVELGELFYRLGSRITMVEIMPRILSGEDPETSAFITNHFHCKNWGIHTGRPISGVESTETGVTLRFEDGEELSAQKALIAVGRRSPAGTIAPEAAGLALDKRGWLKTDECLRASDRVYAVGDINGRTLLANAADNQARYAVNHLLGKEKGPYAPPDLVSCTFGAVEVMRVGPTADALRGREEDLGCSRANLEDNPIAQGCGHPEGFVKMLWQNSVLRSVTVVGHDASHLGGAAALLVRMGLKRDQPFPVVFALPTLDLALEAAALAPMEQLHD